MNSKKSSRRSFLKQSFIFGGAVCLTPRSFVSELISENKIPLIDYHVHLTPGFTIEDAVKLSEKSGIKFGIVEHPGPRYTSMNDDAALLKYIEHLRKFPVHVGLQPVDPGWKSRFSEKALSKLDYIIMDALELPNEDGSYFRIWEGNTQVDDIDRFMERYIAFYKQVLSQEKPDILASPTYLPDSIKSDYKKIWTKARMKEVIKSAVENNVAIEINSMYKIPDERFVKMAKDMGAKFSFGTNGRTKEIVGNLDYSLGIAKSCNLTENDFFSL